MPIRTSCAYTHWCPPLECTHLYWCTPPLECVHVYWCHNATFLRQVPMPVPNVGASARASSASARASALGSALRLSCLRGRHTLAICYAPPDPPVACLRGCLTLAVCLCACVAFCLPQSHSCSRAPRSGPCLRQGCHPTRMLCS